MRRASIYGDQIPLVERLRGMKECLAYIRQEALTYDLDSVAEALRSACDEIDNELDQLAIMPAMKAASSHGGERRDD